MIVMAIDEGNEYSGYAIVADDFTPLDFGKVKNKDLIKAVPAIMETYRPDVLAIEKFESYGMAVGRSVFDSCVWAGRFIERFARYDVPYEWVARREEKLAICGSMKAKDRNIRMALIEKFAQHDFKNGKGTKDNQDFFYGFKADVWAAYAIAYTYLVRKQGII